MADAPSSRSTSRQYECKLWFIVSVYEPAVMWVIGFALLALAAAGEITARSPVLYLTDGRLWKNQTLEVRCDATDADITYLLNGVSLQITCLPPQYVFELQQVGKVPRNGQLNLFRTCKTRGSRALNATRELQRQLTVNNEELSPGMRRLLQVVVGNRFLLPEDIPLNNLYSYTQGSTQAGNATVTLHETLVSCYGSDSAARICEAKLTDVMLDKWNSYTTCVIENGRGGCTGEKIDFDTFRLTCGLGTRDCQDAREWRKRSAEEQALYATALSFRTFMQATDKWQSGILRDLDALTKMDRVLLNLTNASYIDDMARVEKLRLTLADLNAQMDIQANATRDLFTERAANYSSGLNVTQFNARKDAERLLAQLNDPSLAAEAQRGILDTIANQYATLDNITAAATVNMRDTEALVQQRFRIQTNENRDIYRTLRELNRGLTNELQSRGFMKDIVAGVRRAIQTELAAGRHPFLVDTGTEATQPWDTNTLLAAETVRLLYRVQSSPGVYVGHEEDWTLICDSAFLVSEVVGGADWFQLLSNVGPSDCVPSQLHSCQCHIRRKSKTCTLRSNYSITEAWVTDLVLDGRDCLSPTNLDPEQVFVTPVDFIVAANTLCRVVSGDNITTAAHFVNRRATFDVDDVACAATFEDLDSVGLSTHPIVALLGYFELGFNQLMSTYDTMFDALYGVVPNGLDLTLRPIARQDAQAARCVTAGFMSFYDDFLPVYRVVPVTVDAAVEVRIDGVLVSRTNDVTLHTPLGSMLPGADYIVVGDPRNETLVYDVPQTEISLAPTEYARRGKVTYVLFAPGETGTTTEWVDRNGVLPVHAAAQNVAHLYRAPVANGRCTSVPFAAGSWCAIRERFVVVPVPSNSSRLAFTPRTGEVLTASVTVPVGEITQEVFSVCPVMQSVAQGGGTQLTFLSSVASGTRSVNLTLIVHFADVCDTLFSVFQLAPGGSFSVFVPRCGDTAHASLFRGADGEGDACPGVQNVDLVPAMNDYRSVYGNFDVPRVNLSAATTDDEALLLAQRLEVGLTERMLALLTGYVNAKNFQGLPIKSTAFDAFLAASRNVTTGPLFPPLPERPAAVLTFTREDYDRQNAAYMARAQQNLAELEAFQGTAEAFMAIAIEQQNINVQNLLDTRNQTDILGRAAEAYSRDFILSSDGLAAMSGAQAGANSGVPPPGWRESRKKIAEAILNTTATNDTRGIADAYAAEGMDEALKRKLGYFSSSTSFWTGFGGIIVINILLTLFLSYNLVKEDTMFSIRAFHDCFNKFTCGKT